MTAPRNLKNELKESGPKCNDIRCEGLDFLRVDETLACRPRIRPVRKEDAEGKSSGKAKVPYRDHFFYRVRKNAREKEFDCDLSSGFWQMTLLNDAREANDEQDKSDTEMVVCDIKPEVIDREGKITLINKDYGYGVIDDYARFNIAMFEYLEKSDIVNYVATNTTNKFILSLNVCGYLIDNQRYLRTDLLLAQFRFGASHKTTSPPKTMSGIGPHFLLKVHRGNHTNFYHAYGIKWDALPKNFVEKVQNRKHVFLARICEKRGNDNCPFHCRRIDKMFPNRDCGIAISRSGLQKEFFYLEVRDFSRLKIDESLQMIVKSELGTKIMLNSEQLTKYCLYHADIRKSFEKLVDKEKAEATANFC